MGDILMEFLDILYVMFTSEHQKWNTVICGFTAISTEPILRLAVRLSLPKLGFVLGFVHHRTGNEDPVGEY